MHYFPESADDELSNGRLLLMIVILLYGYGCIISVTGWLLWKGALFFWGFLT